MLVDCSAEEVDLGAIVLIIRSGLNDGYIEAVWLVLLRSVSHLLTLRSPATPPGCRLVVGFATPDLL